MKKITSLVLSAALTLGVVANAAEDFSKAPEFSLGSSASGSIVSGDTSDTYKFNLATSGKVLVDLSAKLARLNMTIYDKNGKEIWTDKLVANETTKEISYNKELTLCKGAYYVTVSKNSGEGDYTLTISDTAINETFSEEQGGSDNAPKTANNISIGSNYVGCIATNDDTDTYCIEVKTSGKLGIDLTSSIPKLRLRVCDESGKEAWNDRPSWDSATKAMSYKKDIYLNKGKYYFSVSKNEGEGDYSFTLSHAPIDETFAEPHGGSNNDTDEASIININQKYNGLISVNDDADFYEFSFDGGEATFNVSSQINHLQLKLHNESGKVLWWDKADLNSTTNQNDFSHKMKLDHGKYFFSIEKGEGEGEYTFYVTDGGMVSEAATSGSVITVRVNGKNLAFDQPPVIEDGRTLVPLRAIFEALGADVNWEASTQTVTASKGSIEISLQIGSNAMYVNGTEKTLDVPAKIIGGRTLVPVRAISEALNCAVNWDGKTKTVIVNNN